MKLTEPNTHNTQVRFTTRGFTRFMNCAVKYYIPVNHINRVRTSTGYTSINVDDICSLSASSGSEFGRSK